ncbi:MAG TPA: SAM-dependent methyltransferase [Deltaproteobacteria bacterium]|nr:SAM-dependent methyltransferase [Deltaproteobacteria bacterium]HCY11142.1 SAM-dependent methyltransferase [Deltaproteobacteria bacterium]
MPEGRERGGVNPSPGLDGLCLAEVIASLIRRDGPITFAKFMEMALYYPGKGYYTSGRRTWGPEGDYITSIDVSSAFARTIAKELAGMWEALGRPVPFVLVEAGAGRGWLTRGIIEALESVSPGLLSAIRACLVERNTALKEPSTERAAWYESLEDVPPFESGCILSNELIDSFPVHRVLFAEGSLKELYVGHDGSAFFELPGALSTVELAEYLRDMSVEPFEGMRTEVNLEGPRWLKRAAALMGSGFIMTIDYGLPARELYSPERKGSLFCHFRHTLNDNPFLNIGAQDITTHVDFTALALYGGSYGLGLTGFATQKNFLLGLGILEDLKAPPPGSAGVEEIGFNRALARLIAPGGMGDTFKVLIQHKGVAKPTLLGFSFKDSSKSLGLPSML